MPLRLPNANIALDPKTEPNIYGLKLTEGNIPPLSLTKAKIAQAEEEPISVFLFCALGDLPSLRAHGVEEFHDDLFILARNVFGGVEIGECVFDLLCE